MVRRERDGISVLHVDDDPALTELVGEYLEREDERLSVRSARSASEAQEVLDDADIDCIVSDYALPGQDGIAFLETVREEYPDLPFVLFTGKGSEKVASEAIEAGVTTYLRKEAGTEQYAVLANHITNAVESHRSQQTLGERTETLRRYEHVIDSMLEGACIYDENGHFDVVNDRVAEWYGTTTNELEGEPSTLVSLVRGQHDGDPYQALLDGERETIHGEIEAEFPDHGHAVLEYRLTPVAIDGSVHGVVGVTRDITERREHERRLQRLSERLELAVEGANLGVWDWNLRTDEVEFNEQWAEMIGHPLDEIDQRYEAWKRRVHPDDRQKVRAEFETQVRDNAGYQDVEYRLRTADGSYKWMRSIGRVVERDEDQEPIRAAGIHIDIDERKRRERALEESEQRYRSLFESNPAVIWVEDFSAVTAHIKSFPVGDEDVETYLKEHPEEMQTILEKIEVIDVSKESLERYGAASKAELIDNLDGIFTAEAYEANAEIWARLANGETHFRVQTVAETLDGDRIDEILDVKVPEIYAENHSRVYLTAIDITARKEYERRLESQRDNLTVLNQIVRHDIRNELQVVTRYAESLQAGNNHGRDAERILDATRDAVEITDMAREVTEIMLQSDTDLHPVGLRRVLEAEISDVGSKHEHARVTTDGPIPTVDVLADDMLEAVFRNLLNNAVRHNDNDRPEVSVSATVEDGDAVIRVADDGPGIPDAHKARIFEQGETRLDNDGTGLGLYLVETLLDRYNGQVHVEDNEPRGAVFVVKIPVTE
ncbi:PAS domain S-box protein [Halorhabdus amylolytica]|uniref:PAS domain S-box protein n=1 Tax=Halorhabdus amylolytica TaxID=2559573 RepID=UPI0010AA4A12|nr:PAS domain S-box protein [Halorhabdus amylolytica]